jgi:hypothetical protein
MLKLEIELNDDSECALLALLIAAGTIEMVCNGPNVEDMIKAKNVAVKAIEACGKAFPDA